MSDNHEQDPDDGVDVEQVARRMTLVAEAKGDKDGILLEGFLVKQGGNYKSWKRRYFVMTEDSIAYLDKKGGNVKGGILMESIEAVVDLSQDPKMKETAFSIITASRTFIQHAGTREEKMNWMTKIKDQVAVLRGGSDSPAAATPSGPSSREEAIKAVKEPFIIHYHKYHNGAQGRSNAIRSLLEDAGAKYEVKEDSKDFLSAGTGFPTFAVPALEHGSVVVGQTAAVLQYIGHTLGYIPSTPEAQANCMQVTLNGASIIDEAAAALSKTDEEKDKFLNERLVKWFSILDAELTASKNLPFYFGKEPVYCDFMVLSVFELMNHVFGSKVPEIPAGLKVWEAAMHARPNIVSYFKSDRRAPISPIPAAPGAIPLVAQTGHKESPEALLTKIEAIKESNPDNLAVKHFDRAYYDSLSDEDKAGLLQCINSGIENPDSGMGCYAMQPSDYDRFKPFFSKVLAGYHKVSEDAQHKNDWSLEGVEGIPEGGKLDLAALGLPELSMRVRVGRNLQEFPLPGAMTKEDRVNMEAKMCKAFDKLAAMEQFGGHYNSLTPGHENFINESQYQALVDSHIMFKDMAADSYLAAAGIASDWPYGRGCFVSADKSFVIWVGEEDHLRIMCMKKGTMLNDVFDQLKAALDVVNNIDGLEFATSSDYGVVTSCPTNLGTGMRASVHIPIPNLTADGTDKKAKEICKPLGLSVRGTGGEHTPIGADGTCDISPSARFCITEAEIITALYNGLKLLKEEESKASKL